ncbi:glycosyltransferase family 2 protein [Shewanella sp.]|uniref:glycosyltransferase family 2 protein n=1 Tax=Shewanella sp. TaxID=50422 RepID=UPI004048B1BE
MPSPSSTQPLVSVITPNFNGERFIRRVVESVRQQNYPVEHIIVDDCSTDRSWALLQELCLEYPWLKPVRLEQNAGPVVARNRAIEMAQGRFLAFLDVDDFWLPHKLQTQVDFMLSKNCGLSFSDYRFVSEDGRKIGRRLQGFNQIGWHLHHMTRYLGCLTIILDREKYPDFRIPEIRPATRAEDFLAWSQCIQRFGPALRCPHDLARYSVVPNSRSAAKKGSISVWRLYRHLERIPLHLVAFYFFAYAAGVLWKRYWNRPFMKRAEVDQVFEWSLLPPCLTKDVRCS